MRATILHGTLISINYFWHLFAATMSRTICVMHTTTTITTSKPKSIKQQNKLQTAIHNN